MRAFAFALTFAWTFTSVMSSRTSAIQPPIFAASFSFMPRVVMDAVPTRMPEVLNGDSVS